jgi:hypothetical protein
MAGTAEANQQFQPSPALHIAAAARHIGRRKSSSLTAHSRRRNTLPARASLGSISMASRGTVDLTHSHASPNFIVVVVIRVEHSTPAEPVDQGDTPCQIFSDAIGVRASSGGRPY